MKNFILITSMSLMIMSCGNRDAKQAKTGEIQEISQLEGQKFNLNQNESDLNWRGTKPGGEHYGTVVISEGFVNIENAQITGGSLTINLNEIVCLDLSGDMAKRLEGHLKSEDFFHVEMFPKAIFDIAKLEKIEDPGEGMSNYMISGNLTMRGITKGISFPAMVKISGKTIHAKSDEFSINRTLWGVNFKSKSVFAEFKDDFIGDMINLKFDIQFTE